MRYREIKEAESTYDIQAKYDKFNALYFNGLLPKIPLSFEPLKGVAGVVKFRLKRVGRVLTAREVRMGKENLTLVPDSVHLILSNKFKWSDDEYDSTLLHEMIHVFFITVGNDLREKHGYKFDKMRIAISRASGINITKTETLGDRELNDDSPIKAVGVLVFTRKDGRKYCILISPNTAHNKTAEIKAMWGSQLKYYAEISLYTVATPIWTRMAAKYPIQRAMSKLHGFEPGALEDLLTNGHELFKIG
jgi:hypothetical protein